MKAVILAGGKGTRLKPYTTVFPKPLMPVGDWPIIEIIIRQLKAQGLEDIVIAVGHLGELIMNFLGDGSRLGVKITYSREERQMGTAGGLAQIKNDLDETFLMINGDTLTLMDFSRLIEYHRENRATATIALNKRQTYLDFGIIELGSDGRVQTYTEKPTVSHLVSMGVNILEPSVFRYIKAGKYLDFPDLIKAMLAGGETVKGYVFDGYWLDIGRPEDYARANEEIEELNKTLNLGGN